MIIGRCLNKIKYLLMISILFSVQCQTLKTMPNNKVGLKNFFSTDSKTIGVIVNEWPLKIYDIDVQKNTGFVLESIEKYGKNKSKIILNKLDNSITIKSLQISYKDNLNKLQNTNVFFYSKIIDLDNLGTKQKFKYDRKIDLAPPILKMSSLQVGDFVVCDQENGIKHRFESDTDFYLLISSIKVGNYKVSEGDCTDTLFEIIVR